MSVLFRFWVANIVIGRRCLGELSAMYADIGNLIGLFAEKAVGILLASTTGHRCRRYLQPPLGGARMIPVFADTQTNGPNRKKLRLGP